LDIDGVINCLGAHGTDHVQEHVVSDPIPAVSTQWAQDKPLERMLGLSTNATITVFVPHRTADRIRRLAELFEVIWCTSWRRRAHGAFQEVLGLPEQPWESLAWTDWKLPAMLHRAQGRRWAWLDDEIDFEARRLHPAFRDLLDGLVETDEPVGLTDDKVSCLERFASRAASETRR
jgi:hypothetical protein